MWLNEPFLYATKPHYLLNNTPDKISNIFNDQIKKYNTPKFKSQEWESFQSLDGVPKNTSPTPEHILSGDWLEIN